MGILSTFEKYDTTTEITKDNFRKAVGVKGAWRSNFTIAPSFSYMIPCVDSKSGGRFYGEGVFIQFGTYQDNYKLKTAYYTYKGKHIDFPELTIEELTRIIYIVESDIIRDNNKY